MNTPSVVGSTAEDEQASTLKKKLTQDLRNNLPEYVQLKTIRNHQKRTVEVMGVVTKTPLEPYRPKSGPRDYLLEVIITDPDVLLRPSASYTTATLDGMK